MAIPTEPIGSIPRPARLIGAGQDLAAGRITAQAYGELAEAAVRETIAELEATGSPVITDGEQGKPSFATYPLAGLAALASDGVVIPSADGHTRQLPRLTAGPFRYARHAEGYLQLARRYARVAVKQPVIAASALSLIYPDGGIGGYPREAFLADLVSEAAADIRGALDGGAHSVQIDFTEGRLAVKLDPSGRLLRSFVDLNNQVLAQFSPEERRRIGVHTCPGVTRIPRTAPTSTTPRCCPACSVWTPAPSTSSWPASRTVPGSCAPSPGTPGRGSASL